MRIIPGNKSKYNEIPSVGPHAWVIYLIGVIVFGSWHSDYSVIELIRTLIAVVFLVALVVQIVHNVRHRGT